MSGRYPPSWGAGWQDAASPACPFPPDAVLVSQDADHVILVLAVTTCEVVGMQPQEIQPSDDIEFRHELLEQSDRGTGRKRFPMKTGTWDLNQGPYQHLGLDSRES